MIQIRNINTISKYQNNIKGIYIQCQDIYVFYTYYYNTSCNQCTQLKVFYFIREKFTTPIYKKKDKTFKFTLTIIYSTI